MKNRIFFRLLTLSIFSMLVFSTLFSQTTTWLGGTGNWVDATKWSKGQVPSNTDDVLIPSGRVIVSTSDAVSASFNIQEGAILDIFGAGVLNISSQSPLNSLSGTLTNAGILNIVGQYNTTLFLNATGQLTNASTFKIENTVGEQSFNYQTSITVQSGGDIQNQIGGIMNFIGTYKAINIAGIGSTCQNMGTISIQMPQPVFNPQQFSTLFGEAIVTSGDSEFTNFGNANIIINGGGDGILVNANSTFTNAGNIKIGNLSSAGAGISIRDRSDFINSGGAIELNNLTQVGELHNNRGVSIEGENSTFTNSGSLKIGSLGNINDDAIYFRSLSFINNTDGYIEINRTVGYHAFYCAGATLTNNGVIKIGNIASVGRTGFVFDAGNITNSSSGNIEIDGVTGHVDGIYVGAILVKTSATLTNQGILKIGTRTSVAGGIGNQFCSGGTVSNTGTIILGDVLDYAVHGTQENITNQSTGTINILTNGSCPILGKLSNNGTINNDGSMSVLIGGFSKFINNGTVNNNGSFINTATISGTGTFVQNNIFRNGVNAKILPGSSPGTLTFTGNLDLGSATYTCEINGATVGSYDVLASSGINTLSNATLNIVWGFTPVPGNSFRIMTFGSRVGQFNTVTIPPISNLVFDIVYNTTDITVTVSNVPITITSVKDGSWSDPTVWSSNPALPTATDDVIINHAVTNPSINVTTAVCKNLTINTSKMLTQYSKLQINGDMLVNGTFSQNFNEDPAYFTNVGNVTMAGINIVTVNGTMDLGGSNNNAFNLAGRMVFNTGSVLNLKTNINFSGWSGSTPQYLLDIDNLTTFIHYYTGATPTFNIIGNTSGNTKQAISPNRNLPIECETGPSTYWGGVSINPTAATTNNYYIGDVTLPRQKIHKVFAQSHNSTTRNLFLNNIFTRLTADYANISSSASEYSLINVSNSTLYGKYTLTNSACEVPQLTMNNGTLLDNTIKIGINVTDSAIINIPSGASQNILGTFTILNGKVIVKGGILDLRNANISGLSNTNYFMTKSGGAVLLPALGNTPVTFNLGLGIPNGTNPPTNVFAPLNIISNIPTTNTDITISLQTLSVPSGYIAPTIQWNITPVTMSGVAPNLNITFTWPTSAASTAFNNRVNESAIYHYNTSITPNRWELLPHQTFVDNGNGTFSITVTGITAFSPFAVMIPTAVLKAELINFSAKNNDKQAELNWQTATETNLKNFDIEKSLDGQKFEKIAEIQANNTPSVYQAFDNQFFTSSYYRLKINDLNSTSTYSKIIYLEKNSDKTLKITRDTEGSISIETNDKIELVTITNTIGQVIKTTKDKRFLIDDLNAGIYIVSVKTDKGFLSQKVFKN